MIKNERKIAILLATYNAGERLKYLINSLYSQTEKDWNLYVHDDSSSDGTKERLSEYAEKKENFYVLGDNVRRGACDSFLWLLQNVDSDFYMFCDQDDIWLPYKIEISLAATKNLNDNIPICVNTDLAITDGQYNIEDKSLWKISKVCPQFLSNLEYMSLFPFVTGCTMLFNRKAKEVTVFDVENIPMHDWWICINILKNDGKIVNVNKSTILYCQHGNNTIGALDVNWNYTKMKASHVGRIIEENKNKLSFINKNIMRMSKITYLRLKLTYLVYRIFI